MLVLLTAALMFTPVGLWTVDYLMESTPLAELPEADAIVVLGGDYFRAADAVRVYRAGKAPVIVLSAGNEPGLLVLDAAGVPRSDVWLDPDPKRTIDHPRTILALEGIDRSSRLILISSRLHQRRALESFRQAGYEHVWMCSMEWEFWRAREKPRVHLGDVASIFYDLSARGKSWLVDRR